MDVLILGANGLLGSIRPSRPRSRADGRWRVRSTTAEPDFETPLAEFDIRERQRSRPDRAGHDIFNCAAMTNVNGCEQNLERAHEINATAPRALAEIAAECDIEFVHVSTDYVFDGRHEHRIPNPPT